MTSAAMAPCADADLVAAAAEGDGGAWDRLVDRYAGTVWMVARGHGLGGSDAAAVSQATWMRLADNLDLIEPAQRVGAWLATTACRESLRVLRLSGRPAAGDEVRY